MSILLSPSSTVFRIRRKRNADPLAGLVVLPKRTKNESNDLELNNLQSNDLQESNNIMFRLIGTSDVPHAKNVASFLEKEHKVIEMVDYNPEQNLLGSKQISVLDKQYFEVFKLKFFFVINFNLIFFYVMEAANAIKSFNLDEQERKDFENESTAPLAKQEIDDEECNFFFL